MKSGKSVSIPPHLENFNPPGSEPVYVVLIHTFVVTLSRLCHEPGFKGHLVPHLQRSLHLRAWKSVISFDILRLHLIDSLIGNWHTLHQSQ